MRRIGDRYERHYTSKLNLVIFLFTFALEVPYHFSDKTDGQSSTIFLLVNTISLMETIIHPLVFLNISDHYTRSTFTDKSSSETPEQFSAGVLMGTQIGRKSEVFTSFEVKMNDSHSMTDSSIAKEDSGETGPVNKQFIQQRAAQIHECYSDYTILGWYLIGEITPTAVEIHQQISKISERSLVCLVFSPKEESEEKQFVLYELHVCSILIFTSSHFLQMFREINFNKLHIKLKHLNPNV